MVNPQTTLQRQHELDALRAFAMLLGIVLHGGLSFATGFPWITQDLYPEPVFMGLFYGIHGFRMALFMLISGYFTMMLWRRRGLASMVKQRSLRVLVPCLLGLVTVMPALIFASITAQGWKTQQDARLRKASGKDSPLVEWIRKGDTKQLAQLLKEGNDPNQPEAEFGIRPLGWAAMLGDVTAAQMLLDAGADVHGKTPDGYQALHQAAFFGHPSMVALLLEKGADPNAKGRQNDTALDTTKASWELTEPIGKSVRVPVKDKDTLEKDREACRTLLKPRMTQDQTEPAPKQPSAQPEWLQEWRNRYRAFLTSPSFQFQLDPKQPPFHLIFTGIFGHLWFLWFLCWYVVLFIPLALVSGWLPRPWISSWWVLGPGKWLWIVPLTMVAQLFMGVFDPTFGPDTSAGVIPQPHLLLYYGVFFFFGAVYFDCDDRQGRLGRSWWWQLPLALVVVLPLGLSTVGDIVSGGILQTLYAWMMSFGLIGLFRSWMSWESKTVRYISDSAYWMYLAHLPLLVILQAWVRPWPVSAYLKFSLVCLITFLILLVTYQYMVRYTWIGWLLNGTRRRSGQQPPTPPEKPGLGTPTAELPSMEPPRDVLAPGSA